jgi:hypothetical protein
MDGFLGYYQVRIIEEDKKKTTLTTEWGSFAYNVMPFGFKNVPAVFSRIVIAAFSGVYSLVPGGIPIGQYIVC